MINTFYTWHVICWLSWLISPCKRGFRKLATDTWSDFSDPRSIGWRVSGMLRCVEWAHLMAFNHDLHAAFEENNVWYLHLIPLNLIHFETELCQPINEIKPVINYLIMHDHTHDQSNGEYGYKEKWFLEACRLTRVGFDCIGWIHRITTPNTWTAPKSIVLKVWIFLFFSIVIILKF